MDATIIYNVAWLGLLRPMRVIGPAALTLILLPGLYHAANIDQGGGWIPAGLLGARRFLSTGPADPGIVAGAVSGPGAQ
jgi:hypothetical protein